VPRRVVYFPGSDVWPRQSYGQRTAIMLMRERERRSCWSGGGPDYFSCVLFGIDLRKTLRLSQMPKTRRGCVRLPFNRNPW